MTTNTSSPPKAKTTRRVPPTVGVTSGDAPALHKVVKVLGTADSATFKALMRFSNEELGRQLKDLLHVQGGAVQGLPKERVGQNNVEPTIRQHSSSTRVSAAPSNADTKLRQDLERQAAAARKALVEHGELIPAAQVWEGLGLTRQSLSKAVIAKRIFTVDVGAEQFYPAFYLSAAYDRRKLEAVAKLLGDLPGGSKWQFFTQPKGSLGGLTPLEALERGQFVNVKDSAQAFAER